MDLLEIITANTSSKSGIGMVQLAAKAGISLSQLKPSLIELHRTKKIMVREGINYKLIFPATCHNLK